MSEESTTPTTEAPPSTDGANLNEVPLENIKPIEGQPDFDQGQQQLFGTDPQTMNAPDPNEAAKRDDAPEGPSDTGEPPAAEEPPAEEAPAEEPPQETPEEAPEETPSTESVFAEPEQIEVFSEHIAHHSNGRIQSLEDLNNLLTHVETLESENAKLKEPRAEQPDYEFTSESAKKLYEFAKNFDGTELDAARSYLRVMSLDVEKMQDKSLLFESFMLDPENVDLTREQGKEIFDKQYERQFEDMDDILTQREHTKEVRKAKDQLVGMQKEALEAKSEDKPEQNQGVPQEEMDQLYNQIDEVNADFQGLAIPVDGGDDFNFIVEHPDDLKELQQAMRNPVQWMQDMMEPLYNEQTGEIDMDGYQATMATLVFAQQIHEAMLNHGRTLGKVSQVRTMKSPTKRLEPSSTGPGVGADSRSHDDKVMDKLGELLDNY